MQGGNDDALAVIVDRYQRLVFSVAVRIVKDRCEAEDVAQIVFLEIFRHATQFDPVRGTLKTWLLQYAYSRSLNRRKELERSQFYSHVEMEDVPPSDFSSYRLYANEMAPAETARLVEEAISKLNTKQREAVELLYFEGLKFSEAVEMTGESLSALRHNYYRALMKIREFIGSRRPEPAGNASEIGSASVELGVIDARARSV